MKKILINAAVIFLMCPGIRADSFGLIFQQSGTSNLFQNSADDSDYVSMLGFNLEKGIKSFTLFTGGSYSLLHQNPDLSLYSHNVGLDFVRVINTKTAFYLKTGLVGEFYRSDYRDFNSIYLQVEGSLKSYLSPSSILNARYSLRYRNYRMSSFDYVSHQLLLTLDKHFQTQTLFKGALDWGYKSFLHPYLPPDHSLPPEIQEGPKGKGHGYSHMNNPRGLFPESRQEGESHHLQVLSLQGEIGQSLSSRLGLKLAGLRQWTLSGKNPYTTVEEYYLIENPTYDRFSWSGSLWSGLVTFLVPGDIQTEWGYSYAVREYPGIESLDTEGISTGMDRKDRRRRFIISLQKDFTGFSIQLSFIHIWNGSNDPFFDWGGSYLSVGVQWSTFFGK